MLYFPTPEDKHQFDLITWPLPKGLLPWLYRKGLGVCVLPRDPERVRDVLFQHFKFESEFMGGGDTRLLSETAFYSPYKRLIVLHQQFLYDTWRECTTLHEIGHAVDFLYYDQKQNLSEVDVIKRALRPDRPLNPYCKKKQKANNDLNEQFACSFAAYFKEPEPHSVANHVNELSKDFIELMQHYIISPFKE